MDESVTISVIVPVYNVAQYLRQCFYSIARQTYRNLEIILVDDGSTDGSGMLCDELAAEDDRTRVIHKENGGLASARNAGIDVATGGFIGFVDSDDWIAPQMYEKLLEACIRNHADLACCGRVLYYSETFQKATFCLSAEQIWSQDESLRRLLVWDHIDSSSCDKLFAGTLFSGLRFPVGKLNEDIFVMYQIFGKANRIVHIDGACYYYRQRTQSITRSGFSLSKMDLFEAISNLESYVKINKPQLAEQLQVFYMVNLDILIYSMRRDRETKAAFLGEYSQVMKAFWGHSRGALFNPFLCGREKLKLLLVYFHLTNWYLAAKNFYLFTKNAAIAKSFSEGRI